MSKVKSQQSADFTSFLSVQQKLSMFSIICLLNNTMSYKNWLV